MDIKNLICLPRMLGQGEQKSGFSLRPQFAYLESTKWSSQMSGVYSLESSTKEKEQNVNAI